MDGLRLLLQWGCFLLVFMCSQVYRVEGEVDIRITLTQYNHTVGERANAKCCQNINSYACAKLQKLCDYKFQLCLDSDPRPECTTTSKQVFSPSNTENSFSFDSFAKIQLMLQDQWQGSAKLKVVVYDGVLQEENRVDTIKFNLDTLGTTPVSLTESGIRTSPTSLSLDYTAQVPCRATSNCEDGFFVCDSSGVKKCHTDYVEDGICKTQKVKNTCTLPENPSPPVALQGYFKGTHTCTDVPSDLIFFNNRASSEAYIEYAKDGNKFREGLKISQVNTKVYTAAQGSQLLLTTGTPLNVAGEATVGSNATEFTYVFGNCTVNFTIESVSGTELCHGGGQCTKESGVEFCCCDSSFEGAFCEKQGDICSPNPCQGGGNCTAVNGTDFTCNCSSGYYGKTCEVTGAAVTCSGEVCSGTVCQKATGPSFSCECPAEVTTICPMPKVLECQDNMYGLQCDKECIPRDDCEGHYTCDVTSGDIICYSGYKGDNCTERDFRGTGSDPECPASGSCPGGHCFKGQCCCPDGYQGINCNNNTSANASDTLYLLLSTMGNIKAGTTSVAFTTEAPTTMPPSTSDITPTKMATDHITTIIMQTTTDRPVVETTTEEGSKSDTTTMLMSSASERILERTTTIQDQASVLPLTTASTETKTTLDTTTDVTTTFLPSTEKSTFAMTTKLVIATDASTSLLPFTAGSTSFETTKADITTDATTNMQYTTASSTLAETTTEYLTTDATTLQSFESSSAETTTEVGKKCDTDDGNHLSGSTDCQATTEAPTTEAATTEVPTTEAATTEAPTTKAATTEAPTTEAATTQAPTTEAATTQAPTTAAATTEAPTTEAATTEAPTTEAATTQAPTTEAATTQAPTTAAATTEAPTTKAATTEAPTTKAATTVAPTTEAPTTEAPTTKPATSEAATTEGATTEAATTTAAITAAPVTVAVTTAVVTTTTAAATTAAPGSSTIAIDNVTLSKLLSLLLQILGQTALPQVQNPVVPQALSQRQRGVLVQQVAGDEQDTAALTAGDATSYLPCPWTNFKEDVANNELVFTLDCTSIGLTSGIEARIKLLYQIIDGDIVTEFEFYSDDATVQTLLREAVEKALTDNELEIIDEKTVKDEQFPYAKRYELDLVGTYLDRQWVFNLTAGIAAAFSAKYPDKTNLKVWAPRVLEAIGEKKISVTAINYWVGIDGDRNNLLDPVESAPPTNAEIAEEVTKTVGCDILEYTGDIFNYQDSFGLFIKGKVFEEDEAKFDKILQTWWRTESGEPDYALATVMIKSQEKYFILEKGQWRIATKLVYFVELPDASFVSGSWFDVPKPSTDDINKKIDFLSAGGGNYTVLKSISRRFNQTRGIGTASNEEIVRAKETYSLFIIGRYSTNVKLTTTIETNMISTFSGAVNATSMTVIGSEELIGADGDILSKINIAILNNKTGVDARRIASVSPSEETITEAIGSVSRANGEAYEFVTDREVIRETVMAESCYRVTIKGTVTSDEFEKFESSILEGLLETNTELKKEFTRVEMKTGIEMISAMGFTLTELYYVVIVTFEDLDIQVDASVAIQNRVNVETLRSKIDFKRPDGSDYEVIPTTTTNIQYRDTMSLFVDTTVVQTDYSKFEAKLATIIGEKVTSSVTEKITVTIAKQERSVTTSGEFLYKLSYCVKAGSEIILPEAIEYIEPSRLQSDVKVTNPAGVTYELKVESAEIDAVVRESELFYSVLSTSVAETSKASIQTALEAIWIVERNETLNDHFDGGTVECKILAIFEYASATGVSFYKMSYKMTVGGELVSAKQIGTVSLEKVQEEISQVKNPQGVAYEAVTVQLSTLTDVTVSTSVVISTAFTESLTVEMEEAIIAASSATLTGEAKTELKVKVIRQREVLVQTTGSFAYAVDYQLIIGGQTVSASVLPAKNSDTLISTFKASTGIAVEVLSVSLTKVYTLESSYSLTLNYDVQETKFDSFKTVIMETFKTETSFASATLVVTIVGTEEVIEKETSTTAYYLRYLVQVDGKMLDARIDSLPATETLTTKISAAQITSANGEMFDLLTFNATSETNISMSSMLIRKSQCASMTVKGEFSTSDNGALSTSVKNVITDQGNRKKRATTIVSKFIKKETKITVIQQRETFDATGGIYTEVLLEIMSGSKQVNPALINPIKADTVMAELSKQTLVKQGGYTLVSKSVTKTLMVARQAFTFVLDAPVYGADITTLETKLTTTFKARAEFSSVADFKIKVVHQTELLSITGTTSYKIFYFAMSGTKLIRSSVVKTLSTTELSTSLSFSMTSRVGVSYSQVISVNQKATGLIRLSSLHSVTFEQKMAVSSYAKFESTVVSVITAASGLTAPSLKVVAQQEFISVTGQISHRLMFSCKVKGKIIRAVDVKAAKATAVSSALISANIKSVKGLVFTVLERTTASTQVRAGSLFKFTLKSQIQNSDISIVQSAMAKAYAEVHVGVDLSSISVVIMRQSQVFNNLGGSYWKIQFSVRVNGVLKSAIVQGQISKTKVTSSLMTIQMTGSSKTYGSQVIDISTYVTYRKETLTSIVVSKVVTGSLKLEMEAAMAATLKASVTSLASEAVTVKIVNQEQVITASGETKIKLTFAIKAGGKVIDYRDIPNFSKATLTTKIQASNTLVLAGINFEANVDVSKAISISKATTIFFENTLSKEDTQRIMIKLKLSYKAEFSALSKASFQFVSISKAINVQGKTVTAFKFFIRNEAGQVIKQSLSKTVLKNTLASITTTRQEKLAIKEETATSTFIQKSSCFSLVLKSKVQKTDIAAFEAAVAQAWVDKRQDYLVAKEAGGDWKVTIIGQEEGVDAAGKRAVKILYKVSSLSTTINKRYEESVTTASVKNYLDAVTVSGTGTKYGAELLTDADAVKFVPRVELCLVVMDQFVAESAYLELSQVITSSWKEVFPEFTSLTTSIRLQKEMILKQTTQKYGVYYEAVSADAEVTCPDFRSDFMSVLAVKLSESSLKQLTIASTKRSELTLKSDSFFMIMSTTINIMDVTNVETAIAGAWGAVNVADKDIKVKLSIQDEMINLQGDTVWKIHFFISTSSGLIRPSTVTSLTFAQLQAALDAVQVGSTAVFYSSKILDVQVSVLYEYRSSFFIHVKTSVNDAGITAFTTALKNAWIQTAFIGKTVDILMLQQEEIVDKFGTFAIRLIYSITVDGVAQDSRAIAQLSDSDIRTHLVGQVQGPSGPYVIVMSIVSPLYRLSGAMKIYIDANVPNADNSKFEATLSQIYMIKLQSATVKIVFRDQYIKQGRFVTALYYFVSVNGQIALRSTLPELTVDMQASIKVPSGANTFYKIIGTLDGLFRYRYHFAVYLSRPILTIHVNDVLNGLLAQFKIANPDLAADLTIHRGVQEEAVDVNKMTVWRFVFFLKNGDEVVQSALFTPLSSSVISTALSVVVTGSQKYSDFVLDTTGVYRLTDLLSVALNSKAAVSKFTAFENGLTAAWEASNAEFDGIKVMVATQGKYVSKQGEIVYILYYKATLNERLLSGLDFSVSVDLLEKYLKVQSPQGVLYSLYTDSTATLRRYKSAFNIYLSRVVQSSDTQAILSSLQASWSNTRPDLSNVLAETPMEEEFILTTGESVYKFSYFISADDAIVDALFDAPLSNAKIRTALDAVVLSGSTKKYSAFVRDVDLNTIEDYTELIPVPFTSMVALADFTAIGTAIQTVWRDVGSEWSTVVVKVRAQEEMVVEKGNFVYALLYSVTKDGKVMTLEDLPEQADGALDVIEGLQGLKGSYKLADVKIGDLRRYKLAMSVFLDKWVAFGDLNKLTLAIQNTIKEVRPEYFSLRIDRATQQWFVTEEKTRVVKFVFFGYLGTRLLDGRREASLDKAALSNRLALAGLPYQVVGSAVLEGVKDLRDAHIVYIEGRVALVDVTAFNVGLQTIWKKIESKAEIEIALSKEEYIGGQQTIVTGLVFFVMSDGKIISSLAPGGPTREAIAKELLVTSQRGTSYKVFEGQVVSYEKQYSLLLVGELYRKDAAPLVPVLKELWEDHLESDEIEVMLTKAEINIGSFGGYVTKLMYSLKVDDQMTFPADRPAPSASQVQRAILKARLPNLVVFNGQSVTRVDHTYSVAIEGDLDKAMGAKVMAGVRKVWGQVATASLINPTYHLIGQFALVSLSRSIRLTKVIYQVKSEGKAVLVEDVEAPATADIETELRRSASLEVYGGAALQVRNNFFQGVVPKFAFTKVESSIQAAWAAANVGNTIKISVITHDKFISRSWSEVTRIGLTVRFNDNDVDKSAVLPSNEQVANKLAENDMSLCGCDAKRKYQTFIKGKSLDVNFKLQQIVTGLRKAWARVNPEIHESKFQMLPRPLVVRNRRAVRNNTEVEFVSPDGLPVTPVTFTLAVEGQDPDLILVAPPDLNTLNDELQKASGLISCGCTPRRCHVIRIKGMVKESDKADIIKAIKESYSKANLDTQEKDIEVTIASINNDKRLPESGLLVGEVKYCVSSDLLEPDFDDLKDAFKKYGKELFDGDIDILDPENNQWIMIILIACGSLALILVLLAVIKVCCRLRRNAEERKKVDDEAGGYSAPFSLDDEVYAGHGTYQQAFSKISDAESATFYGKGQMYDPKSYITTPGNMLMRN